MQLFYKSSLLFLIITLTQAQKLHNPEPILRLENHLGQNGQYKYGYDSSQASRDEIRGPDGITRGYYSFIDDLGQKQFIAYEAGKDGYKTETITETPAVVQARRIHEQAYMKAKAEALKNIKFDHIMNILKSESVLPQIQKVPDTFTVAKPPPTFQSDINFFTGLPNKNNNNFDYTKYNQVIPTPKPILDNYLSKNKYVSLEPFVGKEEVSTNPVLRLGELTDGGETLEVEAARKAHLKAFQDAERALERFGMRKHKVNVRMFGGRHFLKDNVGIRSRDELEEYRRLVKEEDEDEKRRRYTALAAARALKALLMDMSIDL